MTFRDATEGIPADTLARAFRVSPQTVYQYRMDPSASGYRPPPSGWQHVVNGVLRDLQSEYADRSALLGADSLEAD